MSIIKNFRKFMLRSWRMGSYYFKFTNIFWNYFKYFKQSR